MKVEGPKSTSSVQQAGRARKTGASGKAGEFAAELEKVTGAETAPETDAPDQVGGVLGVGGLIAAQTAEGNAAPDYRERQRRAQRGADLLDRLEEIRRGLLTGAIPKDRLASLAHAMREKRDRGADPVIARLLDEIELRAEIELAKLSRKLA